MEQEKTPWSSYVGMNQGYNQIFDNWQEISDIISPEANKAVNMALRILDEALDDVKKTVVAYKPEAAPALQVVQPETAEESENEEPEEKSKEKKGFGGFKIFGGKK